jgi:hypothetical protein
MADQDLAMPTPIAVLLTLVAATNLWLIVPGVLAFLGIWKPPASNA